MSVDLQDDIPIMHPGFEPRPGINPERTHTPIFKNKEPGKRLIDPLNCVDHAYAGKDHHAQNQSEKDQPSDLALCWKRLGRKDGGKGASRNLVHTVFLITEIPLVYVS